MLITIANKGANIIPGNNYFIKLSIILTGSILYYNSEIIYQRLLSIINIKHKKKIYPELLLTIICPIDRDHITLMGN
jgi:hypothetical protein